MIGIDDDLMDDINITTKQEKKNRGNTQMSSGCEKDPKKGSKWHRNSF